MENKIMNTFSEYIFSDYEMVFPVKVESPKKKFSH